MSVNIISTCYKLGTALQQLDIDASIDKVAWTAWLAWLMADILNTCCNIVN